MRIFLRDVAGGRTLALSNDTATVESQPAWSPDGGAGAVSFAGGVYVASSLGGGVRPVVAPAAVSPAISATWAPDGLEIAVVRSDSVLVYDAAGGIPGVEAMPGNPSTWVAIARIDPSYFTVLQSPVIAGRAFTSADLSPDARVVIVDQGFADMVMPGRNVIGHRVRLRTNADSIATDLPWYEIIGVVKEHGMAHAIERSRTAGVYLPNVPGSRTALNMIVRGRGDPSAIGPRVRDLATAVDPALRIESITRLDQLVTPLLWFLGLWQGIIMGDALPPVRGDRGPRLTP